MKSLAWASLCLADNDAVYYRIRFNRVAGRLLDGVNYVTLSKTTDGSFVIITPTAHKQDGVLTVTKDTYGFYWLHITKAVTSGYLSRSLFRNRYKVKRDKKGRIYICLKEVVSDD